MFGIFISLLQPVMDGTEFLFFWLPLVFLGTFMPLWIGYWRGAIVLDSNLERARGWEYLLGGVGAGLASEISLQVWVWAEGVGIPPLTLPLVWLGCTVFVFVLVNYPATRFLAHVIRAAGIDTAGEAIRTTHDRALKLGVAVSVISIVPQRVRQYFGNTLTLEMVAFLALTIGVPVLYGVWKIMEERRSQQQTQPVDQFARARPQEDEVEAASAGSSLARAKDKITGSPMLQRTSPRCEEDQLGLPCLKAKGTHDVGLTDSKLSLEYRKFLADMYTNMVTSHGAMLFASLVASVSFLGIVVGNPTTVVSFWGCFVSWTFLGSLLGFTSYVVSRILWYGRLLTITNDYLPQPGQGLPEYGVDNPDVKIHDPLWEYSTLVTLKAYCECGMRKFTHCIPGTRICDRLGGIEDNKHVPEAVYPRQLVYGLVVQPESMLKRIGVHVVLGLILSSWMLCALASPLRQPHIVLSAILLIELFSAIAIVLGALMGRLSGLSRPQNQQALQLAPQAR
jgi:hypothetical protein